MYYVNYFSHIFMYLDGRDISGFGHVFLYSDQMDKTSWFLYFLYRIVDENLEVWNTNLLIMNYQRRKSKIKIFICNSIMNNIFFYQRYELFFFLFYRVSLTYRVKSAHKVKLTDKQLLQWMVPILLVMLIYLGTWTLSAPPYAEEIADNYGLKFNQCSFNWWDHSLAIGTKKKS